MMRLHWAMVMGAIFDRFKADRTGGVALMFGLAATALLGAVGVALDYSRAASVQSNLQRAADGVALLAAKNHDQLTAAPMTDDAATEYVRKTFSTEKIADMKVKLTFLSDRVRVDASAIVPTTISNVIGIRQVPVGGISEAMFGETRVEVALVLDNTGSMAQLGKMDTLKSAAHNFLTKMQASTGNPNALRVAIVPFGNDVNLGTLKTSWWVDPNQIGAWTANPALAGCIWDREEPNDASDTPANTALINTLYSADATRTQPCDMAPVTPLTNDFTLLHGVIDQMKPSGSTNLTIGLAWGLHALSPGEPITTALPYGSKNLTKYLILMTDGLNTRNRFTTDAAAIDVRTQQICQEIRSNNIQVFTARIIEGNAALLQGCASSPTMYFDVQVVSQLTPVFDRIYATIVGSRLAR